jgi:hypothetical protein
VKKKCSSCARFIHHRCPDVNPRGSNAVCALFEEPDEADEAEADLVDRVMGPNMILYLAVIAWIAVTWAGVYSAMKKIELKGKGICPECHQPLPVEKEK